MPQIPVHEFLNDVAEIHATAMGGSFGALTAFLWEQYSQTIALAVGAVWLSVVTGIRFHALLRGLVWSGGSDGSDGKDGDSVEDWLDRRGKTMQQVRREGHYSVTAFTVAAALVYVALTAF